MRWLETGLRLIRKTAGWLWRSSRRLYPQSPLSTLVPGAGTIGSRPGGGTPGWRHSQLPDVGLFQAMYVRREALLSSQIEATDCTLDDVLAFELEPGTTDSRSSMSKRS